MRDEAEQETKLVKTVCSLKSIPFHSTCFNTKEEVAQSNDSLQMVARRLRYQFFEELCVAHNYQYILTAHHSDDNLETLLLNFTRGTGIRGLVGIAPKNGKIIRPLLPFSKPQILKYAKENDVEYLVDKSNLKSDYQRNYIRHNVIPQLKTINPNLSQTSYDSTQNIRFSYTLFNQSLQKLTQKLIHQEGHLKIIYKNQLLSQPFSDRLLFELLLPYGFKSHQIETLYDLLSRSKISASKVYRSNDYQACIDNKGRLLLTKKENELQSCLIEKESTTVNIGRYSITIEALVIVPDSLTTDNSSVYLDQNLLQFPLQVRRWTAGDYFYPFGLGKKKKIARFLIDEKVDKLAKDTQLVITTGQKIVWVVGRRMDDRFKITKNTTKILKLSLG